MAHLWDLLGMATGEKVFSCTSGNKIEGFVLGEPEIMLFYTHTFTSTHTKLDICSILDFFRHQKISEIINYPQ